MKLLFVDLYYKTIEIKERNWKIGGRGLASLILDEYPTSIVIAPGLLTGTSAPTGGRYTVAGDTRNGLHFSNLGGFIGSYIKGYGYFAVVFLKSSDGPLIVEFSSSGVQFRSALDFLGLGTKEVERKLSKDGKKVMAVGPAGEMGSKISAVVAEGFRVAGRGMGELFFRKGVKALVFNPATYVFHNSVFIERAKQLKQDLKAVDEGVRIAHPCYGCPIKCLAYDERGKKGIVRVFEDLNIEESKWRKIVDTANDLGVDIFGAYLVHKRTGMNFEDILKMASEGEDFNIEYPQDRPTTWESFLDSAGICKYAAEKVDRREIEKLVEIYKEVIR